MKSLQDSTKSALYGQLLNSIDQEFGGVTLPPEERHFNVWDEGDGVAQQKVKKREAELMKKYGTLEGFEPLIIIWDDSEQGLEPPTMQSGDTDD